MVAWDLICYHDECARRRLQTGSQLARLAKLSVAPRIVRQTQGSAVNVVLISTHEMGRQPFGLASPAAWLRNAGMTVTCIDLSRESLDEKALHGADLIGFYVPMHLATRLAASALADVRRANPQAHLCFYGLYAPMNEAYLRKLGAESILGGEFEEALLRLAQRVQARRKSDNGSRKPMRSLEDRHSAGDVPLPRLRFVVPDRSGLPSLPNYAHLAHPDGARRVAGYTEASRGCKHLCRHCPVVPVYKGRFRVVQAEVVLEDIRHQVALGAEHITFGDPDFFNGIRHALDIVTALHREHPSLTYDVTIKIEHLIAHAQHLDKLRETGCLFVTTAAEAVDDMILEKFDKGHTRADFERVVEMFHRIPLGLAPTFIAFTPWTTPQGYCELLEAIARLDLVGQVAPVQLGIRLLIPAGSRLLDLDEVREFVRPFREADLAYPWEYSDPRMDNLYDGVQRIIRAGLKNSSSRHAIFAEARSLALRCAGSDAPREWRGQPLVARAAIPYLTEPWYC